VPAPDQSLPACCFHLFRRFGFMQHRQHVWRYPRLLVKTLQFQPVMSKPHRWRRNKAVFPNPNESDEGDAPIAKITRAAHPAGALTIRLRYHYHQAPDKVGNTLSHIGEAAQGPTGMTKLFIRFFSIGQCRSERVQRDACDVLSQISPSIGTNCFSSSEAFREASPAKLRWGWFPIIS